MLKVIFKTRLAPNAILSLLGLALSLGSHALGSPRVSRYRGLNPDLPKGIERVTEIEGITEYRMPNGLRILLYPDQSRATCTVNLTYLAGSRDEDHRQSGLVTTPIVWKAMISFEW
jgi:hypothetical protein